MKCPDCGRKMNRIAEDEFECLRCDYVDDLNPVDEPVDLDEEPFEHGGWDDEGYFIDNGPVDSDPYD